MNPPVALVADVRMGAVRAPADVGSAAGAPVAAADRLAAARTSPAGRAIRAGPEAGRTR